MEREANDYITPILHLPISSLLGNPIFISESSYEQDKVRILDEVFNDISFDQQKQIIKWYIDLIHITWKYGFADCVFNFTINNGFDKSGRMIQLDFGEITSEKSKMETMIKNQRWLKSFSYKTLKSDELKSYYSKIMSEELNVAKLNQLWGSELKKFQLPPGPSTGILNV